MQRNGHRPIRDDLRLVDRKPGIRIDHFVAHSVVGRRKNAVGDEGLRPSADYDVFRPDLEAPHGTHIARRGFAQLDDAGRGRVAVLALAHRTHRRVLHVDGRMEIRLADAKGDDVLALADELVHLGEDHEGVFCSELGGAAADLRHDGSVR